MNSNKAQIEKKLRQKGLTDFQVKVLMTLYEKVPEGKTVTYKELAVMSGHPNAYRAVGSVMKANPLAPMVPCHRVVKSDGSLGNYSAAGGQRRKAALLKREGARIAIAAKA